MAKRSTGRRPSRAAAATSGYFSGMSPIGQSQIDEGLPQETVPVRESAPSQVSSGSRVNPSGPITEPAPIPGEAGVRAAPTEASFSDFASQTGRAAGMLGAGATLGALAGDRALASMGPFAGALGTVSRVAGLADDVQQGNWGKAAVNAVGMANPILGIAGDVGMQAYDAATRGTAQDGFVGGLVGRGVSMLGDPVSQLNNDGSQNIFFEGSKYSEAYTPGFVTPIIDSSGNLDQTPSDTGSTYQSSYTSSTTPTYNTSYNAGGPGDGSSSDYADGGIVGLTGPTYADGGAMGESPRSLAQMGFADGGGVGMQSAGAPMQQDPMAMIGRMTRDPAVQQRVQQLVAPAMQSGQLTPDELVTLGRIAEASLHNPQLYPQLRQFAAANGLTPLPPSYDQRVATMLVVASKVMGGGQQATPPGQVPPMNQAQMQNPTGMSNGGMLQGPGTGRSDSIGTVNESTGTPVKVANGEYVIPKHVVDAKGKEFFDKMLRQYAQLTPQGA